MSVLRMLGGAGACFALAAAMAVSPASAQGRADCEDYAREAVDLAHRAEQLNCGFEGPRWSDNRGFYLVPYRAARRP